MTDLTSRYLEITMTEAKTPKTGGKGKGGPFFKPSLTNKNNPPFGQNDGKGTAKAKGGKGVTGANKPAKQK